jgi:hypothetical protein
MTARRGTLARAACTALMVLFAARAVAGAVLCDLYGEHPVPPAAAASSHVHREAARAPATAGHHADDERPADDRSDHACDEPIYLTGASVSAPNAKRWSVHDAACAHVACAVPPPRIAAAVALRQQQTHPPRSVCPLKVSARLRI